MTKSKTKNQRTRFPHVTKEEWQRFEARRDALFMFTKLAMITWLGLAVVLGGIFGL